MIEKINRDLSSFFIHLIFIFIRLGAVWELKISILEFLRCFKNKLKWVFWVAKITGTIFWLSNVNKKWFRGRQAICWTTCPFRKKPRADLKQQLREQACAFGDTQAWFFYFFWLIPCLNFNQCPISYLFIFRLSYFFSLLFF
jgi:hypothetical protein